MSEIFYFGCFEKPGHYLRDENMNTIYGVHNSAVPADFPVSLKTLSGGLFPPKTSIKRGEAYISRINGWTLISFEGDSLDRRPKSLNVFILKGDLTFAAALKAARDVFPQIFERYDFEVILAANE